MTWKNFIEPKHAPSLPTATSTEEFDEFLAGVDRRVHSPEHRQAWIDLDIDVVALEREKNEWQSSRKYLSISAYNRLRLRPSAPISSPIDLVGNCNRCQISIENSTRKKKETEGKFLQSE